MISCLLVVDLTPKKYSPPEGKIWALEAMAFIWWHEQYWPPGWFSIMEPGHVSPTQCLSIVFPLLSKWLLELNHTHWDQAFKIGSYHHIEYLGTLSPFGNIKEWWVSPFHHKVDQHKDSSHFYWFTEVVLFKTLIWLWLSSHRLSLGELTRLPGSVRKISKAKGGNTLVRIQQQKLNSMMDEALPLSALSVGFLFGWWRLFFFFFFF